GIETIGQLAQADPKIIRQALHKPGLALWNSANGRYSDTLLPTPEANKGYGNATTLPADVTDAAQAYRVLLSLCETVGSRMRRDKKSARCVAVSLRTKDFVTFSHQSTLQNATDSTEELFRHACRIFDEAWDGQTPLRQLGVQATRLEERGMRQYDLFSVISAEDYERKAKLDNTVDDLREKYGEGILRRARFVGADVVLAGGLSKERRTGITKPV
ncbi:MAG: DNA polymerase IV, partial [Candidatus Woodwardiibium sp.]